MGTKIIIMDKKKAIGTIMSRRQHPDGSMSTAPMVPERATDEDGQPDGRLTAMQDFMAAHNEGSPQKMMEAMAAFHDLHRMKSEEAQDTEPDVESGPDTEE